MPRIFLFCLPSTTGYLLILILSNPLSQVKLFITIISHMSDFCTLFNTARHIHFCYF